VTVSLGTLLGADLLHLKDIEGHGISILGVSVLIRSMVVLSGIVAAYLA
jgi:uncharacterized membrane protein